MRVLFSQNEEPKNGPIKCYVCLGNMPGSYINCWRVGTLHTCTFSSSFLPPSFPPPSSSLTVQSQVIALPTTRHPTYVDPTTYIGANVAAHEYTAEIPPKQLKLQEEIEASKILEPMHL